MQDLDVVVLDLLLTKAGIITHLVMKDCPYCLKNGLCYIEDEYYILIICKHYKLRNLHI